MQTGNSPGADFRTAGAAAAMVRPTIGLRRLRNLRRDIFLASLGSNVLSVAMPIVILQIYDRILPNDTRETLFLLVMGLVVVVLLDALLRLARSYVTGWAGARFEHYAGLRIFKHMFRADMDAFEKTPAGVHLDRISGIESLRDYYAGQSILLLVDLPFAIIFIGLIAFLQPVLALVPITVMACFALVAFFVARSLRVTLQERTRMDGLRHSFIIEVLNGIHTIKSMAMEPQIVRRYERLQESCANNGFALGFSTGWAQGLGSVFSQVTILSMAGFGAAKVIDGDLTIGGLAACILLAGRSLQPLVRAMGIWTQVQRINVAEKRVGEVLDMKLEPRGEVSGMPKIKGALEFRSIRFAYDDNAEETIKGLDLAVAPGEAVAITGKDGEGKSTLFSLLLGLRKPNSGRVMIDGTDTDEFDVEDLRSQIGYLASSPTLYRGTVLQNLTMYSGDDRVGPAVAVAEKLGLAVDLAKLPDGYDTYIDDGSTNALPGGVRQRIALARVLAAQPPIILFDEANNSLDQASDRYLLQYLEGLKGKTTMLMISHRPSILRFADRSYEMSDGVLRPWQDPFQARPTQGGA